MPIYSFRCPNKHEFEALAPMQTKSMRCRKCEKSARRYRECEVPAKRNPDRGIQR